MHQGYFVSSCQSSHFCLVCLPQTSRLYFSSLSLSLSCFSPCISLPLQLSSSSLFPFISPFLHFFHFLFSLSISPLSFHFSSLFLSPCSLLSPRGFFSNCGSISPPLSSSARVSEERGSSFLPSSILSGYSDTR